MCLLLFLSRSKISMPHFIGLAARDRYVYPLFNVHALSKGIGPHCLPPPLYVPLFTSFLTYGVPRPPVYYPHFFVNQSASGTESFLPWRFASFF